MAISHCYWHLEWSRMAISHCYWHLVVKNGNFTLLLTTSGQRMAISHCYWHLFWSRMAISHCYWHLEWSRMAISHCYWHLLVKNGNFTLLLTSSSKEWQLADLSQDLPADLPPNASWDIYYRMYLAAILYSARKGGNFLLFLNNEGSKQSVSMVQSCQM